MFKKAILAAAGLAATIAATYAVAGPREDNAIKARRGYFQMMLWDLDPAEAMLKGDAPWDAAKAKAYAEGMKELSDFRVDRLFVPGSSNEDKPGETRALPAIWADRDRFARLNEEWRTHAQALVTAADQGQAAYNAALAELGGTCKACHDDFRAKDF